MNALPGLRTTAALIVALALAPTLVWATLKAPTSDRLPRGFVRFHDPAEWPLVAKRTFGVDDGKWTRGAEYLQVGISPVRMSVDRERDVRIRDDGWHGFPVSSVTAVRICRASVPAVLIETRPPGRTYQVVIAHIGASAYSIGYSFASSHPSADVLAFIENFCGYTVRELS